ncbi:MAG: PQQ-binding-like beta-propeller repeat protein [Caulobacteraceae bacterium]|nr:PQQ-binding-like beta-propeller repeat protein [Caulobacteraceae bacterium]
MNRLVKVAVLAAAACGVLSACSTVSNTAGRIWPFGNSDENPAAVASQGERISILAMDNALAPTDGLAGADFYIPEPQPVAAWPLPGGTPDEVMQNVAAAANFQVAWRRSIGQGSGRKSVVTATPVALDGRIYTMDSRARVTASDATNGGQVWEVDLSDKKGKDKEAFGGGLAVADGKIIVTSGFRFVAALDPATGRVLWKVKTEAPIHAAPSISGTRAFAVDVDNEIHAFNLENGEESWSYQAIVEPARILRASSPAIEGDAVVAPFSSGELVAMRATNGNPLWNEALTRTTRTSALSEIRDIPGRPTIYLGRVYAASHSGVFAAMDLRTGQRAWELPVSSINTPWPAGDAIFLVTQDGMAIAVNRETGGVYWVKDLNKGRTYSEGGVLGLYDREARPIWTGPILASNRLIILNDRGIALALNPKTGEELGTLNIGAPAYVAPIAYGDTVYFVNDKAELIAVR